MRKIASSCSGVALLRIAQPERLAQHQLAAVLHAHHAPGICPLSISRATASATRCQRPRASSGSTVGRSRAASDRMAGIASLEPAQQAGPASRAEALADMRDCAMMPSMIACGTRSAGRRPARRSALRRRAAAGTSRATHRRRRAPQVSRPWLRRIRWLALPRSATSRAFSASRNASPS